MSNFGFRLRFLFARGRRIELEEKSVRIPLPELEKAITLKSVGTCKIKDLENLALVGSGFPSEKEARKCGIRLKQSLLILGAKFRLGIDVGKDERKGGVSKFIKEEAKKAGRIILDDIHGLMTYSEELPVNVISLSASGILSMSPKIFIDEFIRIFSLNPELSEKQTLALELYNMSHFESSSRARFVTLVSAIEALSMKRIRSESELKHIDILIQLTKKSGLKKSALDSLINALNNLRDESISKACRNQIRSCLGKEAMEQFQIFYNVRSTILHSGKIPEDFEMGSGVGKLDKMVSDLLLKDTLREGKEIE